MTKKESQSTTPGRPLNSTQFLLPDPGESTCLFPARHGPWPLAPLHGIDGMAETCLASVFQLFFKTLPLVRGLQDHLYVPSLFDISP